MYPFLRMNTYKIIILGSLKRIPENRVNPGGIPHGFSPHMGIDRDYNISKFPNESKKLKLLSINNNDNINSINKNKNILLNYKNNRRFLRFLREDDEAILNNAKLTEINKEKLLRINLKKFANDKKNGTNRNHRYFNHLKHKDEDIGTHSLLLGLLHIYIYIYTSLYFFV
jgi:hypothetical protein